MSKKLLGVGVVLALVAAVLVGVGSASAQSMSLCQTVDALVLAGVIAPDKVAAAKAAAGCGATASYTFTRDLTVGSTGADVTALQNMLGVSPATGYFGAITKAAVVAYQTSKGIVPASGYVGPLTRAALNTVTTTTTTTTTSSSEELEGTDGSISDVDELSTLSNEEVGEGQENVKVLGMDVEASNDGDIQIKSIKVSFDETGSGDSDNLDDYITEVSVYMGSTKVGSADVDDFNEDTSGYFTKTITLSNAVVNADQTAKFYVAVSAVDSFDSGDIDGLDWTVDVENIRYMDGSGVTSTDTTTGDIDGMNVTIDFVGFSAAADTEFKVSLSSDSPEAGVVMIDDADVTDDVVLLKGKIKLEGTSDVVLDELPITFVTTGATDVADVAGTVKLTIDGEEYAESVPATTTTAVIVFDNLDLDISAGDTVNFTISADIEDTDGDLDNGDTLKASITNSNLDDADVENEEGDQLADDTEKTGTATGEAQAFYDEGVSITLSGTPTISKTSGTLAGDSDIAVATIKVKVEANGDTMYFADVATAADGLPHVIASADADVAIDVVDLDTSADADDAGTGYIVEEGTPEYFTFTVTMSTTATTSQTARASITSLKWGSVDGTYDQTYNFNMDDFKSPSTTILQH